MYKTSTNIPLPEINQFLDQTHDKNLERLRLALTNNKWHWMFPDHWQDSPENKAVLFHAINAVLLHKNRK